jgi:hypothetical protein
MAKEFRYPTDIDKYNRIAFMVKDRKNDAYSMDLYLPMPPGIAIGDTMSYGSMNLGVFGAKTQDAIDGLINSDKAGLGAVGEGLGKGWESLKGDVAGIKNPTVKGAILAQLANRAGIIGTGLITSAAEAALYNQKAVMNPNQVTTFNGSNTRSFSFNFKLVGTTVNENKAIKELVDYCRYNAYPDGNETVLEYPSVWNILFQLKNGSENEYISKIGDCYLMSMTTTYNSTTNAFFADGAPFEVEISLSFQETKAMTRSDLKNLGKASMNAQNSTNNRGTRGGA